MLRVSHEAIASAAQKMAARCYLLAEQSIQDMLRTGAQDGPGGP